MKVSSLYNPGTFTVTKGTRYQESAERPESRDQDTVRREPKVTQPLSEQSQKSDQGSDETELLSSKKIRPVFETGLRGNEESENSCSIVCLTN